MHSRTFRGAVAASLTVATVFAALTAAGVQGRSGAGHGSDASTSEAGPTAPDLSNRPVQRTPTSRPATSTTRPVGSTSRPDPAPEGAAAGASTSPRSAEGQAVRTSTTKGPKTVTGSAARADGDADGTGPEAPGSTSSGASPTRGSASGSGASGAASPAGVPAVVMRSGASGGAVAALERRLSALAFDVGPVDGRYDQATSDAVMAFQKQQDLPRTGRADAVTVARLNGATAGTPVVRTDRGDRVEIDLRRQIIQVWNDHRLVRVFPTSTGDGGRYSVGGRTEVARTPTGTFRVQRRVKGRDDSPLGVLIDPVYFHQGIAIHGAFEVPARPASHGCARVPIHSSAWFYKNVPDGTPVYVMAGGRAGTPPQDPPS